MCVFFAHAGEMASVCDVIEVEEEPFFPSSDCDQVCSVFFMIIYGEQEGSKEHRTNLVKL